MRYEAEIDLRLEGDKVECQKYILRARKVLGEVWNRDIEIGGLDESWRRVVLDQRAYVTVYATRYINPIVTITVAPVEGEDVEPVPANLRLAWMPEGIIFTPVYEDPAEEEHGWGLPTRDWETGAELVELDEETGEPLRPKGTLDGSYPQVIINKFVNNKYLDKAEFIAGLEDYIVQTIVEENPLLRATWDEPYNVEGKTLTTTWQILYNPLECLEDIEEDPLDPDPDLGTVYWETGNSIYSQIPGVYDAADLASGTLIAPQFDGYLGESLIFEPPANEWQSHRAEEILYFTPGQEALFQSTNELRVSLGLGRMHRIVRGHANTARISVSEVALSNKQFHDSVEYFRPGYGLVSSRSRSARGMGLADGENLLITPRTGTEWEDGVLAYEAWEASDVHYDNMVNTQWSEIEGYPRAEHFIAITGATVDESINYGELNPPAVGAEWCQLFSLMQTWVPVPFNYNLTTLGSIGNFAKVSRYERDFYYGRDFLFLSYHQVLYAIPNELFLGPEDAQGQLEPIEDSTCMGIFGASEYVVADIDPITLEENENAGQRRLRAVVATSDYQKEPPQGWRKDYEEFKLYVITMPLNNTGDCDWEIEAEEEYLFEDGWIPAMEGHVKFSPDGRKFVFTMLILGLSYQEALDWRAINYTTEYSYLHNPRRSVQLNHIVFDMDKPNGAFFEEDVQDPLLALVNCGTDGDTTTPGEEEYATYYRRSLQGEINAFPDWNDDNELIYIKLVINERSEQHYAESQSQPYRSGTNFMYTIRKMVFPSGKEVVYHQQWMQDVMTVENAADHAINGWPTGDGTGDPYFLMFHYINTRDEDVVYTKRETRMRLALQDGQLYPRNYEYGTYSIHFDGGWDEIDSLTGDVINERHEAVLYQEDAGFYNDYVLAPFLSAFVDGKGWVGLYMDDSRAVYQTDIITPACREYIVYVDQGGERFYFPVRAFVTIPVPGLKVGTDVEEENFTEAEHVRIAYNNYPPKVVDNLVGRPPFAAYRTSCIYGIQQRWANQMMGTNFFWGSSVWNDSHMVTNVAPIINPEYVSLCQVARYDGRVMVRLENRKRPYATMKDFTQTGYIPEVDLIRVASTDRTPLKPDWDTVPEDAKVLLWANFDIDEAAGIEDVTDIQPFGRVG